MPKEGESGHAKDKQQAVATPTIGLEGVIERTRRRLAFSSSFCRRPYDVSGCAVARSQGVAGGSSWLVLLISYGRSQDVRMAIEAQFRAHGRPSSCPHSFFCAMIALLMQRQGN